MGLSPDDLIWLPTTFTKNRERLLNEQVMGRGRFLEKLINWEEMKKLLSNNNCSVDGTLLKAWTSHASLERIDDEDDSLPPPSGPGEGFGEPKTAQKRRKTISVESNSAIRPLAPERIPSPFWPASPTFIQPSPAIEAKCS